MAALTLPNSHDAVVFICSPPLQCLPLCLPLPSYLAVSPCNAPPQHLPLLSHSTMAPPQHLQWLSCSTMSLPTPLYLSWHLLLQHPLFNVSHCNVSPFNFSHHNVSSCHFVLKCLSPKYLLLLPLKQLLLPYNSMTSSPTTSPQATFPHTKLPCNDSWYLLSPSIASSQPFFPYSFPWLLLPILHCHLLHYNLSPWWPPTVMCCHLMM